MKYVLNILVVLVMVSGSVFAQDTKVLETKHKEMLYPVVRVMSGNGGGSGTILYSEDRGDGCQTYIMTNHHVVDNAIKVEKRWSSLLQADIKQEVNELVNVEIFKYNDGSKQDISDSCKAEIVAHSGDHDLALLKLQTARKFDYIAKFLPENTKVNIFEKIWAIGCSLLHPPVVTEGVIDYLDDIIERKLYWMGSAPIIFGNSGGAVYLEKDSHYYFIGVPSRVAGTFNQAVPHMGWFVPAPRIREWLKTEHLEFLVDGKSKPASCFETRKNLRKRTEVQLGEIMKDEQKLPQLNQK